jgi:hypothetical protein
MLTAAQLDLRTESARTRRARPVLSPKQRYHEYLMQRIEDYKNSLAREELLRLGNDAALELQDADSGQYFLTEVVMQETVDRLIIKRLSLPTFSKWRLKFARMRTAQQAPTHWGLERNNAVSVVLPRLETGDHALVVGGGAEAALYLLAAHEVRVTCLVGDDPTCTRIETRMAAESLTGNFDAYVAMLGGWFPSLLPVHLVVIDAGTLGALPGRRRLALMAQLQDITVPGGVHAVLPGEAGGPAETWLSLYPDWERIPIPQRGQRKGTKQQGSGPGMLVSRPLPSQPSQASTA